MYAVILSGGKQHRISEGDILKIESLPEAVGSDVEFSNVLLLGEGSQIRVGTPYLTNAKVKATILSHGRHKKVHIVKFKRRKHHEKWQGHRQNYTEVKVTAIEA